MKVLHYLDADTISWLRPYIEHILSLNEALVVGLPVLADAWSEAIRNLIEGQLASPLRADRLTTFEETVNRTEEFYREVLNENPALR